jgi:dUTPase
MKLIVKRFSKRATTPAIADHGIGYSICACLPETINGIIIPPHGFKIISTGLALSCDDPDVAFMIYIRGVLAMQYGILLPNGVGIYNSRQGDELKIPLMNTSGEAFVVRNGDKLVNLVLTSVNTPKVKDDNMFFDDFDVEDFDEDEEEKGVNIVDVEESNIKEE